MLENFANELKEARLKNELSLPQVAGKTRIDLKFLENMENGNFTFLPELYVKAFIREYSKVVGLDDQEMIDKYESLVGGKPYEKKETGENKLEEPAEEKKEEKEKPIEREEPVKEHVKPKTFTAESISSGGEPQMSSSLFKLNKQSKFILTIIGGLAVVFLIVYLVFLRSSTPTIVNEKSYEQVRNENQKRYEKEKTKEHKNNQAVSAPSDSLSLLIEASDTSWVKVMMDGKKVDEFILFPKSRKVLKARNNFQMTVGNSGAMSFSLDKKSLSFKGKTKKVEYLSIDSSGLKYLHSPPNFNQQ